MAVRTGGATERIRT